MLKFRINKYAFPDNTIELWLLYNQKVSISLTHWGPVMHICISKLIIIASDNGLSPSWRQAIIWTNAGIC